MTAKVLFEDDALLAIDKPAGALVVRGREGEREPSLLDLLAPKFGKLLPVHRLDRGTSGVLLFAKNTDIQRALSTAFEEGGVEKRYLAFVDGAPPEETFTVDVALAPARKGKMKPAAEGTGKPARTVFNVLERLGRFTLLECLPKTGRTHQIRVHLKYVGYPLAVDSHYGAREVLTRGELGGVPAEEPVLTHTPLHALQVAFAHPKRGERVEIHAELPQDFEKALALARAAKR